MRRFDDPDGFFSVALPPGWTGERDDEAGGVELWHDDGPGSLNLLAFEGPADAPADPAEELYAFLDEQGVELDEEEVGDIPLEGGAELALCEYITEPDGDAAAEEDEPSYWITGVATGPGTVVFASYACPAGEEERERDSVIEILASLRLRGIPG